LPNDTSVHPTGRMKPKHGTGLRYLGLSNDYQSYLQVSRHRLHKI